MASGAETCLKLKAEVSRLPQELEAAQTVASSREGPAGELLGAPSTPTHLLLVEDSPSDALLVQSTLDSRYPGKYATVSVPTLEEAKAALLQQAFDAVLLDLSLPDSLGLETIGRLAAAAPNVPIVVLTRATDEAIALQAIRCGAQDYLLKGQTDAATIARAVHYAMDRKRAERALATAAREWSASFDGLPNGVSLQSPDHTILDANQSLCRMLGKTKGELIGQKCHEVFNCAGGPAAGCPLDRSRATSCKEEAELFEPTLNRWLAMSASPVFDEDGSPTRFVHVVRDVTDQRRAQQEIERLNRLYATLVKLHQTVIGVKSRAELFDEVCRITAAVGHFKLVWIGWHATHSHEVVPVARAGDGGYLDKVRIYADDRPEGHGPVGTCIRQRRPDTVNDFLNDPRAAPWHEAAAQHNLRAAAALPIHFQGRVVAALAVYTDEPGAFQDQEVALLEEAAAAVSFALDSVDREADRQRTEQALESEKARAQRYLDVARILLLVLDADGNIRLLNRKGHEILEYPDGELIGRNWFETCLPQRERHRLLLAFRQLAAGDTQSVEHIENRVLTRAGTERLVDWHNTALFDESGAFLGTLSSGEDITERRRMEEALQQAAEDLGTAIVGSAGAQWEIPADRARPDQMSDLVRAGPHLYAFIGYGADDFPGSVSAWQGRIHPDDLPALKANVQAQLEGRQDTHQVEYRIRHRDGSWRWIASSGHLFRDPQGRPLRWAGVDWDITARKRTEEAERQLRQRDAQLAHMNRLHAVGEMAAALAHELNQPLHAINNYVRGIERRLKKLAHQPELEPMIDAVDHASREAIRAAGIVARLRSFVQDYQPARAFVDVRDLLRQAVEVVRAMARDRGVRLELSPDQGLPPVWADPVQLEQVVVNLLTNAVDAVSGLPAARRAVVVAGSLVQVECVEVTVQDGGPGIAADIRDRLFEPFVTTKQNGLGVGLAISRSIVESHGGKLWAADNRPHGAAFHFTIPRIERAEA
jgi:PAS domain S-box-containing protein